MKLQTAACAVLVLISSLAITRAAHVAVGRERSFVLRTDDTRIEIGITGSAGGKAPVIRLSDNQGAEWLRQTNPPLMQRAWRGDTEFNLAWRFDKAAEHGDVVRLRYTNAAPPLVLESIWRARKGRGPVQHWIEVFNADSKRVTVSQQESLALRGLAPAADAQLWSIRRGGANATTEGGTFTQSISNGTSLVLTNNCDWGFGNSPVPWLAVQEGDRRGMYVGWEFSGLGRVHAREAAGAVDIDVGLWPEFKTDIEPWETLRIPGAFVGSYRGDIEEGSYSLHRFIIEKLRPKLPSRVVDPPLTYNLYLDFGSTNANEADVLRAAKFCADLGFEMFMPDAMWYPEVGDWRWDPKRFPRGMKPIRDYVRERGMKQALWCAWSNGGRSTHPDALNVFEHQDWFSTNSPADWRPGPHYGAKLCFGSAEAKVWAINKTQSLVREHDLDYLKHDSDPIVNRCLQTTHRHRHGVDASYWSALGYYEIQDDLRKKFPRLIIEDCSGGGHIKDFGIIQRTHVISTTDMMSNLADRQSMFDSTYAFPPLMLMCYTYDSYWPVKGDQPGVFLWRSAMMGAWHIDPTKTSKWNADAIESARSSARIYKEWIRPMLQDVKVHHVLPRPDGKNWDGLFFWSEPLKRGTLFVFRPDAPESERTVKLKSLASHRRYWVWSEDGSVAPAEHLGAELMHEGVNLRLTNRFNCDLVYVRDEKLGKPKALSQSK